MTALTSRPRLATFAIAVAFAVAAAGCGTAGAVRRKLPGHRDHVRTDQPPAPLAPVAPAATSPAGAPASAASPAAPCLAGSFAVEGEDERGAFTGFAWVGPGVAAFVRHVEFASASAPDGRKIAWLWTGTVAGDADSGVELRTTLKVRDFVTEAGGVTRTMADPATVAVVSRLAFGDACVATVEHVIGGGITIHEVWTPFAGANPARDFGGVKRVVTPSLGPIPDAERALLFAGFASFHATAAVRPYADRPEFKAGRSREISDQTDFEFYRQNPAIVRVVNKVLDPISLAETAPRANAYGQTLAQKAALADAGMETKFIDDASKCVQYGIAGTDKRPSGDGALWQGFYLVAQIERYRATKAPQARANVLNALECLLLLQEIVPDKSQFARTVRTARPAQEANWHRGVGAHAGLEWLEGGNNDMLKGVLLGLARAYTFLCRPAVSESGYCARIQANARAMADDLALAKKPGINLLLANWLAAYTAPAEAALKYAAIAGAAWLPASTLQAETAKLTTAYGVADWSGVNLNFASYLVEEHLAEVAPLLGQDAGATRAALKGTMQGFAARFAPFRSAVWELYGAANQCAACGQDAVWRLREFPVPKAKFAIDHRLSPDFVLSPFPDLPWKLDWTKTDRTLSLDGFPLFELTIDEYAWKNSSREYLGVSRDTEEALTDYDFAYWYGRGLGVIGEKD